MAEIDDEERQLRSVALQNAHVIRLARQRAERELAAERERLRVTLASIGDAVITTDADGRVTFLNRVAETLTGWPLAEAAGRPLADVFPIVNEQTGEPAENPALRALRDGVVVGLANHTVLIARDGTARPIDDTAAPIRDGSGAVVGTVLVFRDVTDRRRAEDTRSRLAAIVESSDDAIVSKTLDGVIRTWNAGAERLFGYTAAEAIGRSILLIIPPERQDEEWAILDRLRRGERVDHFETVRVAKDGRRLDISLTVSPIRDANGRVIGASKIGRNITERKRVEAALRAAEERSEFVRRASGVGFWYCDLPFDVLNWDEQVKAHFHLPPDAPVTIDTFYDRIHPDDRGPTRAAIDRSVTGRTPYDIHYRTVNPDTGAEKWVRAIGRTYFAPDGTPVRFDGVTLDVTEQKRAEDALREENRVVEALNVIGTRLAAELDLGKLLQVITDEATGLAGAAFGAFFYNGTDGRGDAYLLYTLSGAPREAFSRFPHPRATAIFEPTFKGRGVIRLDDVTADPRYGQNAPYRGMPEGHLPVRSYLAVPVKSRSGEVLGGLFLGHPDVGVFTDRHERLVVGIAAQAAVAIDNARLYEQLREQDRRKDEFLALLAHELRNPLAPLRNGLQVIRLSEDRAVRARSQEIMDRQLGHLVRLVDDLLDVSRISQGKMELRRARVRLADVVNSAIETARPLIDTARHDLVVSLPPDPVVLDADLTRLAQVFGNLLTNAAKYTPPGGRIWVTAEATGDDLTVVVRDSGIGIPREALPSIFDMFSQVDRSIERSTGGLGIGLALVRGLVEMHGGTVTAASDGPGRGSTFTVRLPVAGRPAEPAMAAPVGTDPARPARRVLVVDDNRDSAESMAMMLQLLGDEVRTAHDGLAAVEAAEEFRPDVVLMDIGMPRLNGYEATRRIREQPWGKEPIIIALTGWGQAGDRMQSREAGCDGHLVKPVSLPDLEKLLTEQGGRFGRRIS